MNPSLDVRPARRPTGRIVLGLLVVLAGVVLLADSVGLFPTDSLVRYVPALVVLWGLYSLVSNGLRGLFGSLVLVTVGVLWQLVALGYLTVGGALAYWPLLLVFAGVSLIVSRNRRSRRVVARTRDGGFDVIAVLSTADREVTGEPSEGSVVAALGESRIDLRDVERTDRGPLSIDAVAVLGDVELRVPEGWTVAVDVANVLGEVEDRRRRPGRADRPDLVLGGIALLGEITVTD